MILLPTRPCMNAKNTFALNRIFCPKGAPGQTVEESAAHHFSVKTCLNIPEKAFSEDFSSMAIDSKSCTKSAKIPGNWASKFNDFRIRLYESASSNIEEFNF